MAKNKELAQRNSQKEREDVYGDKSSKKGMAGIAETILRRFRTFSFLFALFPVYLIGILAMGLSATPGLYLLVWVFEATTSWIPPLHYAATATTLVAAYFIYGLFLIFIIPLFNWLMPFRVKPFRGSYFSLDSVPWYIHNALTYIVRYTFLEFITPTPLNTLFFKMMGMKIGKGVHINTTNISDPALIEIGDYVTIGGSAHIIAHYGQKGYLVLSQVKIGSGVNIGIKATIMGDVIIGNNAMIGPHEAVLPKTRIPERQKNNRNGSKKNVEMGKDVD